MKSGLRSSLLRLMISFGAIGIIVFLLRHKLHDAFVILRTEVAWPWFFLAILTYLGGLVILSFRLEYVFSVQKIHLKFSQTFYLGFVGLFFNLFFPSAVGGDIAKAYYAFKYSGKKIASTTAVLLDRIMGFVALILMAFMAVLLNGKMENPAVNRLVSICFALMIIGTLFLGSKRFARLFSAIQNLIPSAKWRQRFSEIYHAIYGYKHHLGTLILCVGLSLIGQALFILSYYWISRSLGVSLDPWIFFLLVPVISVMSMAPSIGGLGVREASTVFLFQRFMSPERALALSVLLDMLVYGYSLAAGILFSFRGGLQMKMVEEMEKIQ